MRTFARTNKYQTMEKIQNAFAEKLLAVKAIKLQPNDPFTWASGWKSPIYTDNRKTLAYPELRSFVKQELVHLIHTEFPEAEAVEHLLNLIENDK